MKNKIKTTKQLTPEKEVEIFNARFVQGMTKSEIKREYKITDSQFSRIIRKIIKREDFKKNPPKKIEWVGKVNGRWKEVK